MKKSEMIALIEKKFITSDICDDISELLDFLESQGMLPPEYETFVEHSNQFVQPGRYYEIVTKREWEPEITQETIDQALEHIGKKGVRGEMEITE